MPPAYHARAREKGAPTHLDPRAAVKAANLALRFILELAALAALGYWGATGPAPAPARVLLGVGAPAAAAVFWGAFVAPRARVVLPTAVRMVLGLAVFGSAAAALAARGHGRLATGLGAAAAANTLLMLAWRQDRVAPHSGGREGR
jgi:hypothetical protein